MKVNDYLYRVKTPNGEWPFWYTWKEVCRARLDNTVTIITKVSKRKVPKNLRWS